MNKQEMVDRLVTHSLQAVSEDGESKGSRESVRSKLASFAHMSERRLRRELEFRGLIEIDEPESIDDEEPVGDLADEQLMFLFAGSAGLRADRHLFD
jgi:hypothetical protein